ncbi:MAG: cytochrome C [FCB group bacterium]|nr:cytochrome C [FCB group bacterium]
MKQIKQMLILIGIMFVGIGWAADCVQCHNEVTPGIVNDWKLSKHFVEDVGCETCHGEEHTTMKDAAKAAIPTPETCNDCHEEQVRQYTAGKHAFAWAAMKAMPTTHWKPMALIEGMKGCGGCHKIGLKSVEEIEQLKADGQRFGIASCDACHTRHTFSKIEAQQPQACQTCHMGFDHPQWEMYSSSKHGVRFLLKQNGTLPESASAPTCQTCHMPKGDHEVRTAWGFLAVRTNGLAPYPGEDEEWWANRVTILQALGVLDPDGNPTARLDIVDKAQVARLSAEGFDKERAKMIEVCSQCHSENFARAELAKGDDIIRRGDKLLAEAIRVVAGLYKDGILEKPKEYAYPFPDLLAFSDAPTPIEQRLFLMHLKHRMRLFQGTFHANPDYALWYGWSEMVQDLTEIKYKAKELREGH